MIKLCAFSRYLDEIIVLLNKENIEFSSEECLRRCDLCMTVPFARVNDEFITANSPSELVAKIKTLKQ